MAHFAKVLNGMVIDIIVAEPEFFETYQERTPGEWIQTSYNTRGGVHYEPDSNTPSADQSKALRKNYAAVGHVYDAERDAFYMPQPYPSWTLNEDTCLWEPPTPSPSNRETGEVYTWDEPTLQWVLVAALPPSET